MATKKDEGLQLNERQKGIVAAMLWEEARGALGDPDDAVEDQPDNSEYLGRIDRWEREENGVDRELSIRLDEDLWPEVKRVEELNTTISQDDNSGWRSDYLIAFEDVCVRLKLYFPPHSDNECDGTISKMDLHPAAEADAVWEAIQQDFVRDVVRMAMTRIPKGHGFDRVLRAAVELQAASMTPSAGPQ